MKRKKEGSADRVTLVREVIASGTVTRLDRCACGDLYLTVGPITMSLHPDVLVELSATLGRALARLGCRSRVVAGSGEANAGGAAAEARAEDEPDRTASGPPPETTDVN